MAAYIEELTVLWGLDKPVWQQYLTWLKNYLTIDEFALQNVIPIVAIGGAIAATVALVRYVHTNWLINQ